MARLILDSQRQRPAPARGSAGQVPPGWEAAACRLLDRIGVGPATDALVLSAGGLARESGVTFEAARYALMVLAAAGLVVRQPDLTFRVRRAYHLPPVGRPRDPLIWVQMADSVLAWIELGLVEPGDFLPRAPALASLWGASRQSADRAYRELAWLGYLVNVPGSAWRVVSAAALKAARAQSTRASWPEAGLNPGAGSGVHAAAGALAGTERVADDLFLAAHDERSGRPLLAPRQLGTGLAGALLAEVMLAGGIALYSGTIGGVTVSTALVVACHAQIADDLAAHVHQAVAAEPQLHPVLLDEPGNGLAPEGVAWIRRLLRSLAGLTSRERRIVQSRERP